VTYKLVKEADGTFWIYDNGLPHSRFGIIPADDEERRVLEAVPDLLNKQLRDVTLMRKAYYLYLMKLW
jgi:hypothetical protein